MKLTNDALLVQLGYNVNENTLKDLEIIEKTTIGFENIKNHIIALNDHLKPLDGYVAMSSSNPYLKIKIISQDDEVIKNALAEIEKWKNKYNVELKQINNKTFYILGITK